MPSLQRARDMIETMEESLERMESCANDAPRDSAWEMTRGRPRPIFDPNDFIQLAHNGSKDHNIAQLDSICFRRTLLRRQEEADQPRRGYIEVDDRVLAMVSSPFSPILPYS